MLVVTRKTGQEIVIGDNIRIIVTAVRADRVRLGITAPRNVRVDHYRKAHRAAGREEQLEENPEIPAAPAHRPKSTADLEALLAGLPDSQREVIAMLKVNGMSLEEVAHATSSTVGSVKQKAHRAYDRLRKGLADMGWSNVRGRGLS